MGLTGAARAGVIALDPMTLEFPPNPCFPVTQPRVITWGEWCDATSCPPGAPIPDTDCSANDQPGVAPDLGDLYRDAFVWAPDFSNSVHAQVVPAAGRIECASSGGVFSTLDVAYRDAIHALWRLDLLALGTESIEAVVGGEMSPSQPLYLEVWLGSPVPGSPGAIFVSTSRLRVEAPGPYRFPLVSFVPSVPGSPIDAHQVSLMLFQLTECQDPEWNCIETDYPARHYTLGPLSLVAGGATSSKRSTWAQVKQIYR